MTRQFQAQVYLNLKAGFRDLVALCGGPQRAANLTRTTQSLLSHFMAPQDMDRFPPLDVIADLEAESGQPAITRLLADMAGFDLVPRVQGSTVMVMHSHLSAMAKEGGDVQAMLANALGDGEIDASEATALRKEAREALDKISAFVASLDAKHPVHMKAVA